MFVVSSVQGHIHESFKCTLEEFGVLKMYPRNDLLLLLEWRRRVWTCVSKHRITLFFLESHTAEPATLLDEDD